MDSGITEDSTSGDKSNEMCVPLASLSMEGQAPQEGDMVTIEARVTRVENDMAYVTPAKDAESAPENASEPSFSDSGSYTPPPM